MSIDPVYLLTAGAVVMVLLVTAWLTRPRRYRPRPGTEIYCSCGARANVGDRCARCAWNRGRP